MGKKYKAKGTGKWNYSYEKKDETIWENDKKDEHQCKKYKEARVIIEQHEESEQDEAPKIFIGSEALQKIQCMCILYPDSEFLVYLLPGCKKCSEPNSSHDVKTSECKSFEPDEKLVADVYVPVQTVTMGSVVMEEDENIPPGIIGALHKHPGDHKPSFSCTDDEKLNVNHDLSIVISETGRLDHWHGTLLEKLSCGCKSRVEADVKFKVLTPDIKEAVEKRVTKGTPKYSYGYGYGTDDYGTRGGYENGNEVTYECNHCTKEFKSPKARLDHEKSAHNVTDEDIKESYSQYW